MLDLDVQGSITTLKPAYLLTHTSKQILGSEAEVLGRQPVKDLLFV